MQNFLSIYKKSFLFLAANLHILGIYWLLSSAHLTLNYFATPLPLTLVGSAFIIQLLFAYSLTLPYIFFKIKEGTSINLNQILSKTFENAKRLLIPGILFFFFLALSAFFIVLFQEVTKIQFEVYLLLPLFSFFYCFWCVIAVLYNEHPIPLRHLVRNSFSFIKDKPVFFLVNSLFLTAFYPLTTQTSIESFFILFIKNLLSDWGYVLVMTTFFFLNERKSDSDYIG